MKSETITIEQLFQNRLQYCVPFYQRPYVWTLEDQWQQLWDDIRDKAETRLAKGKLTPHFLGAVVLDPQHRELLIGVEQFHIIDGQQRLTTLQYVLASALIVLRSTGNETVAGIVTNCLWNDKPETMLDKETEIFKVWPTFRDRPHYRAALTAPDIGILTTRFPAHFTQAGELRRIRMDHPPALAALWYFTCQFEQWLMAAEGPAIAARAQSLVLAILRDLKLVSIMLDEHDDAQIIFETLNGRGAQLHATDLIRNYVFMRADRDQADSESLYNTLWLRFENEYWSQEQTRGRMKKPRLEWLIHSALQAELHEDVDLGRLYHEYRRFATAGSTPRTALSQLQTLTCYAEHYRELVSGTGATPIGHFGRQIAGYDITTLYPLALMVSTSAISNEQKGEIFQDLVSYLVRRAVCGLTAKNYNNVFMGAVRQLHAAGITPSAFRAILQGSHADAARWPADAEFKNACLTAALYPGRLDAPKAKALLVELERGLRETSHSEEVLVTGLDLLDVDHILPQSWYAHWVLRDGSAATSTESTEVEALSRAALPMTEHQTAIAAREAAVRTLGNLTLLNLSVNRQAQNFAFTQKRDLLIANTNLRLNVPQVALATWDEETITKRAQALTEVALRLWPGPRPVTPTSAPT